MTDLAELLHDRLDPVPVPPGDLEGVERRGRSIRRRRTAPVVAGTVVLAALAGYAAWPSGGADRSDHRIDPSGPLDVTTGLRAYADPGERVYLGGRDFPVAGLEGLDTDAAATPSGIVFYRGGRPTLLEASGDTVPLQDEAVAGSFRPGVQADSVQPWVAYGATIGGRPTIVVRDLADDTVVGTHEVPEEAVIDALDDGVVFLRTADGTTSWDASSDAVADVGGPKTAVADVRGGVLMYAGTRPDGPGAAAYRLVEGTIDAQLTFDGGHILDWSNRLESTDGGPPLVLDRKGTFFAVDTDGSILMAAYGRDYPSTTFYDCEVPSGACTELGTTRMRGGDPAFIGNDM